MPTTVPKTIGTGGDYTDPQTWIDDTDELSSPNDLVASDVVYEGRVLEELAFDLLIAGQTTDATRFIRLTADTGASLFDSSSNALQYNSAKAGFNAAVGYGSLVESRVAHTHIERLQFKQQSAPGHALNISTAGPQYVNRCLFDDPPRNSGLGPAFVASVEVHAHNWIAIINGAESGSGVVITGSNNSTVYNFAIVRPTNHTPPAAPSIGITMGYNRFDVANGAIFGFLTPVHKNGGAASTARYCATDAASIDAANGTTSLTYADQFEDPNYTGGADFRVKTGHGLNVGTDLSGSNGGVDIFGTAWDTADPMVGCYQIAVSSEVDGDGVQTLSLVVCAAVGTLEPEGDVVQTLELIAQAADGDMTYTAATVQTLEQISQALAAAMDVLADAVDTLEAASQAADGSSSAEGDIAQTLEILRQVVQGTAPLVNVLRGMLVNLGRMLK